METQAPTAEVTPAAAAAKPARWVQWERRGQCRQASHTGAVGVELVPKATRSLGANLTAQAGPRWPVRPIALVTKAFSLLASPWGLAEPLPLGTALVLAGRCWIPAAPG